jgi:predicted NUDIX family NTP pyrophosphohydrolase
MPRISAGLLLFRRRNGGVEVMLVHPGGPFWALKDEGAWTIPKGEIEDGEDGLDAARREVREETGAEPAGPFLPLEPVRQSAAKIVRAWAVEADFDPETLSSNVIEIEWPPRSGRYQQIPEVDRAAWFTIEAAEHKILQGQRALLRQLDALLGVRS